MSYGDGEQVNTQFLSTHGLLLNWRYGLSGLMILCGPVLIGERMAEAIRNTVNAWTHKPCNGLGTLASYDTQAGSALWRVCFLDVVRSSVCE